MKNILTATLLSVFIFSCATKKTAEFYFQQGKNEVMQANDNMAVENFAKAIKKNPNYIDAYMERAKINMSIDSIQKAITDYDSVLVKIDINDRERKSKLLLMKGDAYYLLSEDTLACKCYRKSRDLNNNQAWNRLRDRCKK